MQTHGLEPAFAMLEMLHRCAHGHLHVDKALSHLFGEPQLILDGNPTLMDALVCTPNENRVRCVRMTTF